MTVVPMEVSAGDAGTFEEVQPRERIIRAVLRSPEGRIGVGLSLAMVLMVLVGQLYTPYSPTAIGVATPNSGPSGSHLLGVDNLGRDILSRVLAGGASVLVTPLLAICLAATVGMTLGICAAYVRGRVDTIISRLFDVVLTMPPLLIVLVVIAGAGTSRVALVTTVGVVFAPRMGRVAKGAAQAVVTHDYVAAAQARGESIGRIVLGELLPNMAAPLLAEFALRLTYAIGFVSTLSFFGLGAQPPSSDWGLMVAQSRDTLTIAPLATIVPAAGIAGFAVGFSLIADAVTRRLMGVRGRVEDLS